MLTRRNPCVKHEKGEHAKDQRMGRLRGIRRLTQLIPSRRDGRQAVCGSCRASELSSGSEMVGEVSLSVK